MAKSPTQLSKPGKMQQHQEGEYSGSSWSQTEALDD